MKKRIATLILPSILLTLLTGCGKSAITSLPEGFGSAAIEPSGTDSDSGKSDSSDTETASEPTADECEEAKNPIVYLDLTGTTKHLADGNYPDLCRSIWHAAGLSSTVMLPGADGIWKEAGAEKVDISVESETSYYIAPSVTELLAEGKLTLDCSRLNAMTLDLDPNITEPVRDYGAIFRQLLANNPGSAIYLSTVPCRYEHTFSFTIEDNSGKNTYTVDNVPKVSVITLAIGPEAEVTAFRESFNEEAKDNNLTLTSEYFVSTSEAAAANAFSLVDTGFHNKNDDLELQDSDVSYNVKHLENESSLLDSSLVLDEDVLAYVYDGISKDPGWALQYTIPLTDAEVSLVNEGSSSDNLPYNISSITTEVCEDDEWKTCPSEDLAISFAPSAAGDDSLGLSIICEEVNYDAYAITITFRSEGRSPNDSVLEASATASEYVRAAGKKLTYVFRNPMYYDLFTLSIGDGLYDLDSQTCSTVRILIVKK